MKIVKVFLSSTFKDMNAERDVLIKNVFPRLREWAYDKLNVRIQEIDLRWGVTEEQVKRGQVLDVCLEGIDECKPYFLSILGKRYGWIPAPLHIRIDTFEELLSEDSILSDDEKWLIKFVYAGSYNNKVKSLDIKLSDNSMNRVHTILTNAGISIGNNRTNIDNLKYLIQKTLDKAGVKEASLSITEQEIRHVIDEDSIPRLIINLDQRLEGIELIEGGNKLINEYYKRQGNEPIWYLQPGYSDIERENLSHILIRTGIKKGFHRFFLLRQDIGEDHEDYIEKEVSKIQKLESLKTTIKNLNDTISVKEYPCIWQSNTSESKYPIQELNAFEDMVFNMLKNHLLNNEELKLKNNKKNDPIFLENELHMKFIDSRTYNFKGRHELLTKLEDKIKDALNGKLVSYERNTQYIMLVGEAGSGKSALLAKLYKNLITKEESNNDNTLTIPRFIGASPSSTSKMNLLRDLCMRIIKASKISDIDIPVDPNELKECFNKIVQTTDKRVVIILDAINQLQTYDNNKSLSWLPESLPQNVCIVVSLTKEDSNLIRAIKKQSIQPYEIYVKELSDIEKKDIIKSYLRQYNKQLTDNQVSKITLKTESYNPLFLQVALEELRVVSRYEALESFIDNGISNTTEEMFIKVLERIENELEERYEGKGKTLFEKFMKSVAIGRHGMAKEDIRLLLGEWKKINKDSDFEALKLPQYLWSDLRRSIRNYMFLSDDKWNFFHNQLNYAVITRYLDNQNKIINAHLEIANYLELMGYQYKMTITDLPYHLFKASELKKLENLLWDYRFIRAKVETGMVDKLIEDYNLIPDDSYLILLKRALMLSSHILREYPYQLPLQLTGRLINLTDKKISNLLNSIKNLHNRCWLRPINQILSSPDSALRYSIHEKRDRIDMVYIMQNCNSFLTLMPNKISTFNIETGEEISTLKNNIGKEYFIGITIINDKMYTIIYSIAQILSLCDIETGENVRTFNIKLTSRLFFISGKLFIILLDGKIKILNLKQGEQTEIVNMNIYYESLIKTTTDSIRLVFTTKDRSIKVYNVINNKVEHTLVEFNIIFNGITGGYKEDYKISGLDITTDNKKIIAFIDRTLIVWDIESGYELNRYISKQPITLLNLSNDNKLVAIYSKWDRSIQVFELNNLRNISSLTVNSSDIDTVCISNNNKLIIAASSDKTIKVWNLVTGKHMQNFTGHDDKVNILKIANNDKKLISVSTINGGGSSMLKVWHLKDNLNTEDLSTTSLLEFITNGMLHSTNNKMLTNKEIHYDTLKNGTVLEVKRSLDNKKTVTILSNGTVEIKYLSTGKVIYKQFDVNDKWNNTVLMDVTSDGRLVLLKEKFWNKLYVWDLDSNFEIGNFDFYYNLDFEKVCNFFISSDNTKAIIILGNSDYAFQKCGIITVWDLERGTNLCIIKEYSDKSIKDLKLLNDGSKIVVSSFNIFKVWDIEKGLAIKKIKLSNNISKFFKMNDEKTFIIATIGYFISVWNIENETMLYELEGCDVVFELTSDQKIMICSTWDNKLKVWDIENEKEIFSLCQHNSLIKKIVITPDNKKVISISTDDCIKVWDLEKGVNLCSYIGEASINYCEIKNRNIIASDSKGIIYHFYIENIKGS